MSNKQENFNCLIGEPKQRSNGEWYCDDTNVINQIAIKRNTRSNYEPVPQLPNNTNVNFSLIDWVKNNKVVSIGVAAAIAVILYMYFNKRG